MYVKIALLLLMMMMMIILKKGCDYDEEKGDEN
jgi:hypothetical protein